MSDIDPTQAPADPNPVPVAAAPAKRPVSSWLTPLLAVVAALVIGLFGGILIGQHTGGTQQAGFNRPGGAPGGTGGFGQNGPGQNGPGQNNTGQNGGTGQGNGARPGGGTGAFGGNFAAGTIQSVDGNTITLKLQDGSTVKITTSGTTRVTKTDRAKVSDLSKGETVVVRGTKDSDGNVKATTVTEGQTGAFGARPGAGAGAGN